MMTTLQKLDEQRARAAAAPYMALAGAFHAHLTISVETAERQRLASLCRELRAKLTIVELEAGTRRQQDVMTTTYHRDGEPGAVLRIVDRLSALTTQLEAAGFTVLRAKLEHESLPSIQPFDRRHYHEVHIKLRIPVRGLEETRVRLRNLCEPAGFRPSRNPLERGDRHALQLVNGRFYEGDLADVDPQVAALLDGLSGDGLEVVEVKRETVVFDTDHAIDEWWL